MAADDEGAGAPPARPASSPGTSSGGSVFTRRVAGVPVWLGMLAVLGLVLAYSLWRKNKATASANSTTSAGTAAAGASQTPPFIIQNYTSTLGGPAGPAGPPGPAGTTTGPPSTALPGPIIGHGPIPITMPPTAPPATPAPPPPPAPAPAAPRAAQRYTVLPGDNLSAIAGRFNIPGGRSTGWQILWNYNSNPATRAAAGLPPVRGTNPNLIYPGEVILIPS